MNEMPDFDMRDLVRSMDERHGRERPRRDHRTMLRRLWDAEHLSVLSTKVTTDDARRFRRLCYSMGETPYSMLQAFVLECVKRKR